MHNALQILDHILLVYTTCSGALDVGPLGATDWGGDTSGYWKYVGSFNRIFSVMDAVSMSCRAPGVLVAANSYIGERHQAIGKHTDNIEVACQLVYYSKLYDVLR